MTLLPPSVPEPTRAKVEADLAGYAADFDPRRLRTLAGRMLAHVDPDGPAPAAEPTATMPPRGELWLRDRRDGGVGLEGWFNAEHGAMLRSLIDQLALPRPAADGIPDERSVPARQADALIELADRARGAEDFPTSGGERPHLTVLQRRHLHHQLLPLVPATPPPSPSPGLGPAPGRQPRRIPTARDHRPAAKAPDQPTPALTGGAGRGRVRNRGVTTVVD